MMIFILHMIFYFAFSCNSVASEKGECKMYFDEYLGKDVYTYVDSMPEFYGGYEHLLIFFIRHYQHQEQEVFQASFHVVFIIDKDGVVLAPGIKGKKTNELTPSEQEVIRILNKMPNWKPGSCQGKLVPVKMQVPLRF